MVRTTRAACNSPRPQKDTEFYTSLSSPVDVYLTLKTHLYVGGACTRIVERPKVGHCDFQEATWTTVEPHHTHTHLHPPILSRQNGRR